MRRRCNGEPQIRSSKPKAAARRAVAAPKRRIAAADRRAQIIACARELFVREGIDAVSLRRVAAEAGVTASLLYRHFVDKDALLMAVCAAFFEKLGAAIDAAWLSVHTPRERLAALMRSYLECGFAHPHEYELTFMTALPRLRSTRDVVTDRARLRRGEAMPTTEQNVGTQVFGRLEAAVTAVLRERQPVAMARRRGANAALAAQAAALAEVVWAGGHGLVALLNVHKDFGFSPREQLIETSIATLLAGVCQVADSAAVTATLADAERSP